jgi:hypothetical protein
MRNIFESASRARSSYFPQSFSATRESGLIGRDFPHHVEMIVPEGGFGKRLDAMYEWHGAHNIIAMRGSGRRDENNRDYVTWC